MVKTIKKNKSKTKEMIPLTKNVNVKSDYLSWFVSRMFNPEDNIWVWIRRISNVLTIPLVIMVAYIIVG